MNNAVLNALDILDLLGQEPEGLALSDISLQLKLPASTAHRLLASLLDRGYVQQRDPNGVYSLGWRIVLLANSRISDRRLVQDIRPFMQSLMREIHQAVNLGVLSGNQVMYLDCAIPRQAVSNYTPPGYLAPVHATSLGKALLAFMPEEQRKNMLSRIEWKQMTPTTVVNPDEFVDHLAFVRDQGFASDHGELDAGINCIAAPIIDMSGQAIAAMSVSVRTSECGADWEKVTAKRVVACAQEASKLFRT